MTNFMITRTSMWDDTKPCDEAVEDEYIWVDVRTVDDPHKIPLGKGCEDVSWWYNEGTNHRVEEGQIKRGFVKKGWFIRLESLEELLAFSGRVDEQIILGKSWENEDIWRLEIYDDYRE